MAFNLRSQMKQAQGDPSMMGGPAAASDPSGGMPAAPPTDPSQGQSQQQYSLGSLTEQMESDPQGTIQLLSDKISPDATIVWSSSQGQQTSGRFEEVWKPETWNNMEDPQERGSFLGAVYKQLPQEMRVQDMTSQDSGNINVKQETAKVPSATAAVNAANAAIKKLAEQHASKHKVSGPFNLKTAQRVAQPFLLFGPESTQVIPSVNQVGNGWHVEQRNKAWGLRETEFTGVDFEQVWRNFVMDKYTPALPNEDGELVGGYINNRFEVDKNIPEWNDMHLRPGQKRKPARATLLEGKLEEARGGKAFNWVKANSNSLSKIAQKPVSVLNSSEEEFSEAQAEEQAGKGKGTGDADLIALTEKEASGLKKKVLAYAAEGQQSPNQQAGSPKALSSHWTCQQCGANNGGSGGKGSQGQVVAGDTCVGCGAKRVANMSPKSPSQQGVVNQRGKTPHNYNPVNMVPGVIQKNTPLNGGGRSFASSFNLSKSAHIPDDETEEADSDDKEDLHDIEDDERFNDFKQLRAPAQDDHSYVLECLKNKQRHERSFNALAGDPE